MMRCEFVVQTLIKDYLADCWQAARPAPRNDGVLRPGHASNRRAGKEAFSQSVNEGLTSGVPCSNKR